MSDSEGDITIIQDNGAAESIARKYSNFYDNVSFVTSSCLDQPNEKSKFKRKWEISDSEDDSPPCKTNDFDYFDHLATTDSLFNKYVLKKETGEVKNVNISATIEKTKDLARDSLDECIELLSSGDESDVELETKTNPRTASSLSNSSCDEEVMIGIKATTSKAFESNNKKERLSKEEKENRRLENLAKRTAKKEEAEQNKLIKKAINAANKKLKPEECIKRVTVIIDNNLLSNPIGASICNSLQELGCKYQVDSQIHPNTVTWNMTYPKQFLNGNNILEERLETFSERDSILILTCEEFLTHVSDKTLLEYLLRIKCCYPENMISLGIYGVEDYFKHRKQQWKSKKPDSGKPKSGAAANKVFEKFLVSRKDVEVALCEVQIHVKTSYRFLNSKEDLAAMICQFTKSIAQRPYKLEKYEMEKRTDHFLWGDNKNCVRVDKNGNGLMRLWQQHITSFPLIRLETAESIIDKFPTLSSLLEAYDRCTSESEKENLVADIQIRRNAGIMAGNRKIGIETSKRLFAFYNSYNGDETI